MTGPRLRICFVAAVAGAGLPLALGATLRPTPAAIQTAHPPPRVAVVSRVLDTFETGSRVGPGVINGAVNAVVSSQSLPPPADQVQAALQHTSTQLAGTISTAGPQGIDQMRAVVAPAACANALLNAGLQGFANATDEAAAQLGATIQPADRSLHQIAGLARSFQEPVSPCPH
jgi:hypothetical protein